MVAASDAAHEARGRIELAGTLASRRGADRAAAWGGEVSPGVGGRGVGKGEIVLIMQ